MREGRDVGKQKTLFFAFIALKPWVSSTSFVARKARIAVTEEENTDKYFFMRTDGNTAWLNMLYAPLWVLLYVY